MFIFDFYKVAVSLKLNLFFLLLCIGPIIKAGELVDLLRNVIIPLPPQGAPPPHGRMPPQPMPPPPGRRDMPGNRGGYGGSPARGRVGGGAGGAPGGGGGFKGRVRLHYQC